MTRRLLDTSLLVSWWRECHARARRLNPDAVRGWAQTLNARHADAVIARPVRLEFLAGTRIANEVRLAAAFLGEFANVDGGETPRAVWFEAERLVRRVPRVGSPRHTLDCLIAAVARHFRLATRSGDRRFPRLGGKS